MSFPITCFSTIFSDDLDRKKLEEMNIWLAKVCYDLCLASWLSQLDADYSAKPIEIHSGSNQALKNVK